MPKQRKPQRVKPVPIGSGPMTITLGSIRNTEATLRWQGAQWWIAANFSASVGLLFAILAATATWQFLVFAFASTLVSSLDFEWYSVLRRDGKLLNFWNTKLVEHEEANGIEGGVQIFTSPDYQKLSDSRVRLQRKLERITVVFIYTWAIVAIMLFTWALANLKGVVQ